MLALPDGLIVVDALATPDSRHDRFFLFLLIGRNQTRNRLADDFLSQIAKNALRAGVPAGDDAIEVLADDGVVARFDDSGEPQRGLLTAFALRYVLEAVDGADNVSAAILDRLDVDERDAAQAVRPLDVDCLCAHGNAGAQRLGHRALMVREQTAVGAEHSIRSAKPFVGIAELGRAG